MIQLEYRQPKNTVLQANAKLAQKGGVLDLESQVLDSILTGVTFYSLFSHSKASDANIGIIANSVQFVKNSYYLANHNEKLHEMKEMTQKWEAAAI